MYTAELVDHPRSCDAPAGLGRRRRARARETWAAWLISSIALLVAPLQAHDLGLTQAVLTFTPDGTYQLDVPVDPESLLARLEIYSGQEPSAGVPIEELPSRIEEHADIILARTRIAFDGNRVVPAFTYIPGPPAAPGSPEAAAGTATTATLRFTGEVPAGARIVTLDYGLVLGSYALRLVGASGDAQATLWLAGGRESPPIELRAGLSGPSTFDVARQYFVLGFEHILPKGLDHILFVIGLFLLSAAWRPLLLQVTLFTLAHSITLGLSIFGVVSLPGSIVEPLIALSICYVAVENLFTTDLKPWRAALVFLFGLLHGLGFAGVLEELGLPRSQFVTALVTFNLGVEAGQLMVIALAFAAVGWWRRAQAVAYRRWVVVPGSLAIALVGAYWTVTRIAG